MQNPPASVASLRRLITSLRNADHDQPGIPITFAGIPTVPNHINIFDVQHGNWRDRIELAEKIGFAPSGRQLVIDPDGRVAVVLTADKTFDPPNGVAIIDLGKSPLSIGHLSSATGTVGALIMLRGTGFSSTSLVSVDGTPTATTFIDASTLQITMPGYASGPVGISVTDSGETYTLDDAFNYQ